MTRRKNNFWKIITPAVPTFIFMANVDDLYCLVFELDITILVTLSTMG